MVREKWFTNYVTRIQNIRKARTYFYLQKPNPDIRPTEVNNFANWLSAIKISHLIKVWKWHWPRPSDRRAFGILLLLLFCMSTQNHIQTDYSHQMNIVLFFYILVVWCLSFVFARKFCHYVENETNRSLFTNLFAILCFVLDCMINKMLFMAFC